MARKETEGKKPRVRKPSVPPALLARTWNASALSNAEVADILGIPWDEVLRRSKLRSVAGSLTAERSEKEEGHAVPAWVNVDPVVEEVEAEPEFEPPPPIPDPSPVEAPVQPAAPAGKSEGSKLKVMLEVAATCALVALSIWGIMYLDGNGDATFFHVFLLKVCQAVAGGSAGWAFDMLMFHRDDISDQTSETAKIGVNVRRGLIVLAAMLGVSMGM